MKLPFILLFCLVFAFTVFSQESIKLDEFSNLSCDEYLGRMDVAIAEARNNPFSTVFAIIYDGKVFEYNERKKKSELVFPTFGSADAKIRSMKQWLSHRDLPVERFAFIKGGFREQTTVEIWIVPPGAKPPEPTSTLSKLRYRKGKAVGFCIDCCGP